MTGPRPAAAPTRIGHVCAPSAAVTVALHNGLRSSVREFCPCGVSTVWIRRATDGAIVSLPAKDGGR